jgi:hypothetical protein
MDNELYRLISSAREACAGGDYKELPEVISLVQEAMDYVNRAYGYDRWTKEFTIWAALRTIKERLEVAKDYGGRLLPDQMLCEILNGMLEE